MKVYVVSTIEVFTHTAFEFEHNIDTQIFLNKDKAREWYESIVNSYRKEAEDDELEIEEGENYFDAYLDGEANVNELYVRFREVTPIE